MVNNKWFKAPIAELQAAMPDHLLFTIHHLPSIELLQKPDVVLEKQPDIVQPVHQRTHPVDSQAERKAGIDFRIDAGRTENVRMHHS